METKYSRTVLIGDIHGCLVELKELLGKLHYNPTNDRIICLGDLNDRGPDSVGVIRYCRENNFECVMGNHEYKFLKWFRSQGSRSDVYDRKDYYRQLSDEDIDYVAKMPTYIDLDDVVIVHAGLKPGVPVNRQSKDDLMYLRYTDEHRKFISLRKISKLGLEKSGAIFWTDFGPFGKNIVYGHNVNSYEHIRIDKYPDGTACYGIDTGCCFGGLLTALVWETKEVIQVKAKEVYYQSDFSIE